MSTPRAAALEKLLSVVDALREPDGCPWDRKQTVTSMARYVLEEGYELVEAIEQGDDGATCEELGDCLMVLAMIGRERAAEGVAEKLVRRHPHVFGEVDAPDAEAALASWEAVKSAEREAKGVDASALAGLARGLPALARASRTCEKAIGAGFRWDTAAGALAKVEEELGELLGALEGVDLEQPKPRPEGEARERVEAELGDLLMATGFLARYLGLDPEAALREALRRFEARFRAMEERLEGGLAGADLERMMAAWEAAKRG
jgi:MazG family protein